MSPCWTMPSWMEPYRSLIRSEGEMVETMMNGTQRPVSQVQLVRSQVALLIALREAGELVSAQKP